MSRWFENPISIRLDELVDRPNIEKWLLDNTTRESGVRMQYTAATPPVINHTYTTAVEQLDTLIEEYQKWASVPQTFYSWFDDLSFTWNICDSGRTEIHIDEHTLEDLL